MELKAAQEGKSLIVNILCADNTRVKVKVDPAVTIQELCSMAFNLADIKDTFGFEIFINIFDKVRGDRLFNQSSFYFAIFFTFVFPFPSVVLPGNGSNPPLRHDILL